MRVDPTVLWLVRTRLAREPEPPMTGANLLRGINGTTGKHYHIRRIGEAVRALREEGMLIDSGSRGYVVVTDPERIRAWQDREERRAKAILYTLGARKRLDRQEVERRIGQMGLFDSRPP